jgi:DNA mismatch repair ATPase MutS
MIREGKEVYPCLNKDSVVRNDIDILICIIITGPNAGGKSTFIKTLLINVLLSQTICISTSDYCLLTPFKKLVHK